jgi:hypothetical protein
MGSAPEKKIDESYIENNTTSEANITDDAAASPSNTTSAGETDPNQNAEPDSTTPAAGEGVAAPEAETPEAE